MMKASSFNPQKAFFWKAIKRFCMAFGIGVTSRRNLESLENLALQQPSFDLRFIRALGQPHYGPSFELLNKSRAQLRQDIFALANTKYKLGGYFVEFGATDGVKLSNTFLLETEFSWTGILCEPARIWEESLKKNRPNSIIETLCVWSESGIELDFNECKIPELSTIEKVRSGDEHEDRRKSGNVYSVLTISLEDLLIKHSAPTYIDFLSIDTEGSEFEILTNFDFENYSFGVITVEHNFTAGREKIFQLLQGKGYERVLEHISMFDDWYVSKELNQFKRGLL